MAVFEGENISTMNSVIFHKNPRIPPDAHYGDFPHKHNYHFPRIQPRNLYGLNECFNFGFIFKFGIEEPLN